MQPWFFTGSDLMAIYAGLQSCERLRLSLESFEPEKDQEGFVRDYGTGNAMPDLPQFVNYSSEKGAPLTSSASKVTSRPAQFTRVTQRISRDAAAPQPQPDDEMYNHSSSSSNNLHLVSTTRGGAVARGITGVEGWGLSMTISSASLLFAVFFAGCFFGGGVYAFVHSDALRTSLCYMQAYLWTPLAYFQTTLSTRNWYRRD